MRTLNVAAGLCLALTGAVAAFDVDTQSDEVDIGYQQAGTFEGKGQLSEAPGSWVLIVWAQNRSDKTSIAG